MTCFFLHSSNHANAYNKTQLRIKQIKLQKVNFWNLDSEENSVPYSAESMFHWIRESCDFRVSLQFREDEGKRTVFAFYVSLVKRMGQWPF